MRGRSKENPLLNSDFRDILSAFCEEKVEFMLVGAYAAAAHGLPRATGDIDLWIKSSDENADRVWAALGKFGAPLQHLSKQDLVRRGTVVLEGLTIPVIGLTDLVRNKTAVTRPQDKADVARLQEIQTKHSKGK